MDAELSATRRQALRRLGFTAAVAYAAPTILHLDRSAKAQVLPSCRNPPGAPPDPSCQAADPQGFTPQSGPRSTEAAGRANSRTAALQEKGARA